jgi:four helix bundle protein
VGDFKKLEVWQVAHKVACEVYRATACFPKTEAYGLTAQLRRSAASIPANLAEGSGRRGDVEFSRFVRISLGSATELEYHLLLSRDIGLLTQSVHENLVAQVLRMQAMLVGLNRILKRSPQAPALSPQPIAHSP